MSEKGSRSRDAVMNGAGTEPAEGMETGLPASAGAGGSLPGLLHSGGGIDMPFMRELDLGEFVIVGMRYRGGGGDIVRNLAEGSRVTLIREPDNEHDPRAVAVLDRKGRMIGYIPRNDNRIISALMDAGKYFYGVITKDGSGLMNGRLDPPGSLAVRLYMREFAPPESMTSMPVQGSRGSYAVVEMEYGAKRDVDPDNHTADTPGYRRRGFYVIKVIDGEERGVLSRRVRSLNDVNAQRSMMEEFEGFVGYLPLVMHDIFGEGRKSLREAYGVLLGRTLPNIIIDTGDLACYSDVEFTDITLETMVTKFHLRAEGRTEKEKRCRLVWDLYKKLE